MDYNSLGQVVKNIDEDGFKTELKYNETGLLTSMKCSDGNYVDYEYDGNRFLKAVSGSFGSMSFERDKKGLVKKALTTRGHSITYKYDKFGRTVAIVYPDGKKVSYNYDKRGRLIETVSDNEHIKLTYNSLGRLESREYSDGSKTFYEYNDIAILYRTNLQARLLTKLLLENNIPFIMKDSIPDIFEHWISKDIKSYIKLALSEGNREDVLRIINRPNRFIKREAIRSSDNIFSNLYDYYEDKPFMLNKIKNLAEDLKRIKDLTMSRAVKYIRRVVGYDDFLKEIAKERGIDEQELFDILGELEESAYEYDTFADWVSHMQEYRQELIKKVNESKKENDKELKGVRLMTFHSSKGLEYSVVYIIDANEGYSPYKKAKSKEEVEEERRMFYVAMTRAKDILNICYCKMGFHKRIKPSIFLKEIIK